MTRTTSLLAALTLGLTLTTAACSIEDDEPSTADEGAGSEETTDEGDEMAQETGSSDDGGVCAEFFDGAGLTTLAERAGADRDLLEAGDPLDKVDYGEVNLVNQRLDELGDEADAEQAQLLEAINAPFETVAEAAQTGDAQDEESGEVTVPEDLDLQASADAQAELEAACNG